MTQQNATHTAIADAVRLRRNDSLFGDIEDFYVDEAAMLEPTGSTNEGLLAPDVSYVMPVRATVTRAEMPGFSTMPSCFDENLGSCRPESGG